MSISNHTPSIHPIDPQTTTAATMDPARNEMGNPFFQDLLRYGLYDSNTGAYASEQQGRLAMPQHVPHGGDNAVKAAEKGADIYVDNGVGGKVSQREIEKSQQLVGQALQDRRNLARDRILRGGWTTRTAELALEFTRKIAWKDRTANMTCVGKFLRTLQELGEFCDDMGAIRGFLDGQIHKLIGFQAMEKDFKIPDSFIRRGNQITPEGFKYSWFRSVLQELQNLDTDAATPWLQPYKDQTEEVATVGSTSGLYRDFQGGISDESPQGQHTNTLVIRPVQTSLGVNNHASGRKRAGDSVEELDMDALATKVKRESIEAFSLEDPGRVTFSESPPRCPYNSATLAGVGDDYDGKDKKQEGRRTLTVLFHGMGGDDAKESEHVQVYVPRTAKGMTINFL